MAAVDCKKWRELASQYREETLPPPMVDALQSHLGVCASCRSDEAALRALWSDLNDLPARTALPAPPLFFHENVMAAIQREAAAPRARSWAFWSTLLPQLGRVALGTTVTAGAVAAIAWTLLLPTPPADNSVAAAAGPLPRPGGLLPGGGASTKAVTDAAAATAPQLHVSRVATMSPQDGPCYDFSLWLEPASSTTLGTARFHLLGGTTPERSVTPAYRFTLRGGEAQTLRVPFAAADKNNTINLVVRWQAGGGMRSRYLFVPVPQTDASPAERQSFGLPEGTVVEAARAIAARYGAPVTIEDVPASARLVVVTANNETAPEALRRALASHGLRVSTGRTGILITAAADAP